MDTVEDNDYVPKYHPDTSRIVNQAMTSAVSLLVITLLTIGAIWFTAQRTSSPVILGTETTQP